MFPLFRQLYSKYADITTSEMDSPPTTEINKFLTFLKKCEDDHQFMDCVYLLIRCYQLEIDEQNILENPYGMKKMKMGIKFNFSMLPAVLQHLLIDFMNIHLHKKDGSILLNEKMLPVVH